MRYVCTRCHVEKDKGEFYAYPNNTIKGVAGECKECKKTRQRASRKPQSEADRARKRAWAKANRVHANATAAARNRKRIARTRAALPPWAEHEKIKTVYKKAAQLGLTVDHIVPLQHPLVCGLHVWANLQLLDQCTNSAKRNRYWPDMPDGNRALADSQLMALTT